ncbi:MAG: glycosyltransferase [Chloroflexota bacterium]
MSLPLVSVIIPARNAAIFLPDAIQSIRDQHYEPVEIIVVDDASSDNSAVLARSLGDDIRVFVQHAQGGPAAARNVGIKSATGEFLVFLDADDLLPEGKLHAQVQRLIDQPQLDLVGGYVQPIILLGAEAHAPHALVLRRNVPTINVNLGAFVYRRRLIDRIGLFDETLRFAEDADFALRAEEANAQMQILRRVTLYYRRHPANVTRTAQNNLLANTFRLVLRHAEERRQTALDLAGFPNWTPCLEPAPILEKPRVSVIVPVHDGAPFLAEALASVFAQDCRPDEVIVIDDGSSDESAAIAQTFAVRLISQPQHGAAAARNRGLALASGDLIAFLDADDTWETNKLSSQIAYLNANPQVEYVTSFAYSFLEAGFEGRPLAQHTPLLSTLLARRAVFERVGSFDPNFRVMSGAEWLTRAQDASIPYATLQEPLSRIRLHPQSASAADPAANQRELVRLHYTSIKRRDHERKYQR